MAALVSGPVGFTLFHLQFGGWWGLVGLALGPTVGWPLFAFALWKLAYRLWRRLGPDSVLGLQAGIFFLDQYCPVADERPWVLGSKTGG